jgi:DNA-binding LytR/AlgR family response regulator
MNSEPIKVLIVEDMLLVAEDIAGKLRKHSFQVTAICATAEEAIDSANANPPDLVLMDIHLAGKMDGITAASIIRRSHDLPVIYLSDHTDSATLERAKKTLPANYLTKPFQEPDLIRAIDFAFHNFRNRTASVKAPPEFIFLRTDHQAFVKIPLKDILYLEADRAYCKIVCKDKTHVLSTSMNHIVDQINSPDFIKVHRSFVVNINAITGFDGNMVKVGGQDITMNKEAKDLLSARLKFIK